MNFRCDKYDVSPIFPEGGFRTLTEEELDAYCVSSFGSSVRRPLLFQGLIEWMNSIRQTALRGTLWIDGSFLTTRPEPNDIDLVFLMHPPTSDEYLRDQAMIDFLINPPSVQIKYGLDIYPIVKGANPDNEAYWRGFFGFCRDQRTPKGIAEVHI